MDRYHYIDPYDATNEWDTQNKVFDLARNQGTKAETPYTTFLIAGSVLLILAFITLTALKK